MKTLVLLSVIVSITFVGCKKEYYDVKPEDKRVKDGCDGSIYAYAGTPIAGDFQFARSQVDYAKVEAIIQPIQDHGDLNELADTIVSQFTNPYERVYAIYYWIDENIDYDHAMLDSGEYHCSWQNSSSVLNRKLGVCEGFSNLFCALCKNAGITSTKIWGHVTFTPSHHAWNAVQIENKWYVLDVTWDENKKKSTNYFLIDPQYFYQSHIPHNPKWKLF